MASSSLVRRVEIFEAKVDALAQLPARVTAVETELVALRGELVSFRTEVREEFVVVRDELRSEIRAGDEETRRQMRVLHEDVISRIALLQEGLKQSNGKDRPTRRRNRRR